MALPTQRPTRNPLPPFPESKEPVALPESNDFEGKARDALLKKIAEMAPQLQSALYVEQLANAYAAVAASDRKKSE